MPNVELGSKKTIYIDNSFNVEELKESLTLPNPAYASAMRFSGYDRISLPQNLYYYSEDTLKGTITVPRNVSVPNEHIVKDERVRVEVSYPRFLLPLRKAQKLSVEKYMEHIKHDSDGIAVMFTGVGKSICAIKIASLLKQRTLILVNKDDLAMGWRKDIELCLGLRPKQIGLIKASKFRIGEQLTIATIQTITRMSEEDKKELGKKFGLIVIDECQFVGANTYDMISEYFKSYYRYGTTATDMRNDGLVKVLNFYLGRVFYRAKDDEATDAIIPANKVFIKIQNSNVVSSQFPRYTCTVRNFIMEIDGEEKQVKIFVGSGGVVQYCTINNTKVLMSELDSSIISFLLENNILREKSRDYNIAKKSLIEDVEYNDMVLKDIIKETNNKKSCLVFCSEKDHIDYLYSKLVELGYEKTTQCYYGDSKDKKEVIKDRSERRECLITLATYSIATYGTNIKAFERLFMASPIANEKDLIQAIGRGRRKVKGKTECIVYDYRHPKVEGMEGQGYKRDGWYRKNGFKILNGVSTIRRGFH